jgi:hypothetical protein
MGNGALSRGGHTTFEDVLQLVRKDEYNQFHKIVSQISNVNSVPDSSWERLFSLASQEGSILCLELLLQNAKNHFNERKLLQFGGVALRAAAQYLQVEVIELIISSLGDKALTGNYAVDEVKGRFPIHLAAGADCDGVPSSSTGIDQEFEVMQRRAAQCVTVLAAAAPSSVTVPDLLDGNTPLHVIQILILFTH